MNEVEEMAACLRRLTAAYGTLQVEVSFGSAVIIVAQLQLALRHPANTGRPAALARSIAEQIIARMEAEEPAIGPLLRQGFDSARDVPR